ncbi:MAG: hypothetical protein M3R63_15170 [Actinomycetota bacterium]|nr:hypothetical protein [Actinomycetota bacterium]
MSDIDGGDVGVPAGLLAAARKASAGPALLAAVRGAAIDPVPDPAPGQLWRAGWDEATVLVVVLETGVGGLLAAPVSVDPAVGDDRSLVLEPDGSVLQVAVAVWAGLARAVPLRVLETYLETIQASTVQALTALQRGSSVDPPAGTRVGLPVVSPFDTAARVQAALADTLELLADASWTPSAAPAPRVPGDVLGDRVDLAELPGLLCVNLPVVWDLLRGRRPLSTEQAEALADRYGVDADDLLAAPAPPAELVEELDHPRWRPTLRNRRRLHGLDDADVRRQIAYGTLAMAARQTGTSVPSWRDRIRHYLDAEQTRMS